MNPNWQDYQGWLSGVTDSWSEPEGEAPHPSSITTDSRTLKKGQFFLPLVGESFDGHKFIEEAMRKGAAGFFYAKNADISDALKAKSCSVAVTDTLKALQAIARGWRDKVDPQHVFAITGSNGKTTAKEMLAYVCSEAGSYLATTRSFNNEIGLPLTLLKIDDNHEFVILEMGARHCGDIKFLCDIARPTITCVLNATQSHLGEFGSAEAILETKSEIFIGARSVVCPIDDDRLTKKAKAQKDATLLTFGTTKKADITAGKTTYNEDGSSEITLSYSGEEDLPIHLDVSHDCYAINAAAVAALAKCADIPSSHVKAGLSQFRGLSGRFQISRTSHFQIVDDSYNASPASVEAGIRSCMKRFPKQSKVAVLGEMLELGDISEQAHRDIGKLCHKVMKPDLLIGVGDHARFIVEGAIEAGHGKDKALHFDNVDAASRLPERVFAKRDVIYIKGSNAVGLSKLVTALKEMA